MYYYENYLSSLKKNLVGVSRAINGGVSLSRLEYFDFLFKKELSIVEGLRGKRSLLSRVLNSISDSDYRLACFYAKGLSDIMKTIETGYSVKEVKKQFNSFIRIAESRYICSATTIVRIKDLNGKITIIIANENSEKEFIISNIDDYIESALYILSLLGSYDEDDYGCKEWVRTYLYKEFNRILTGEEAEIFIERESVAKDLKSYMKQSIKDKSIKTEKGKVVHIAK